MELRSKDRTLAGASIWVDADACPNVIKDILGRAEENIFDNIRTRIRIHPNARSCQRTILRTKFHATTPQYTRSRLSVGPPGRRNLTRVRVAAAGGRSIGA